MKRKLVLLGVLFLLLLTVAAPAGLPAGNDVTSGSDDVITARLMDFTATFNYDPECPPFGSGGAGC